MSDNMQDMLNNVKSMINSGNIPDNIKSILSNMQNKPNDHDTINTENNSNVQNNSEDDTQISFSPEMMSTLVNMFGNSSQNNQSNNSSQNKTSGFDTNFDINTILKMKNIIDKMNVKDDPRSNLLRSLKPYLRDSRKNKLDQYVNFMKMANVMDFLNTQNKENK